MPLINAYVLPTNRIADIFRKIQDGQAPERVTVQLLKDWGFTSTNDRAFIPLLKGLGFLNPDGNPTSVYLDYRDHSRSKQILGRAIREAYADIFLIKEHPSTSDRNAIEGKFKSYHNVSDNVASQMTKTFYALLPLADLSGEPVASPKLYPGVPASSVDEKVINNINLNNKTRPDASLHYNIQIHLPATKDIEVLNAIFKSLKERLID
jgi:hypothetical protein